MHRQTLFGLLGNAALGALLAASPVLRAQGADASALPTAEQVLAKYERFLGGAAALAKVTTRTVRTRRLSWDNEPSDNLLVRRSKKPVYSIMYHEALDGTFIRYTNGCDDKSGWTAFARPNDDGAPVSGQASTDGNCEQELYYYEYFPLDLARMRSNVQRFEVKGTLQIAPADVGTAGGLAGGRGRDLVPAGARQVYLLLSVPARSTDPYGWLYFDSQTGALLRFAEAGRGPTPVAAGANTRFTDFVQYREVGDGTRAPFQFVTSSPNSLVRGVHVSIVDNESMADDIFVRPKDARRRDKGL